jgi:hypothetical protein
MSKPMPPRSSAARILAVVACLLVSAAGVAQNAAKKLLFGDTKVETVKKYQGEPLPKPDKVLVYDFTVPSSVISVDTSPAAKVTRGRGKTEEGEPKSSPEAVAKQVQAVFAKSLLRELQQASVPAEAAPAGAGTAGSAGTGAAASPHTLVVQGEFTAINEGNKTKRVLIGFGKGASDVQAHVTVSLSNATPTAAQQPSTGQQPPAEQPMSAQQQPAEQTPPAQPPAAEQQPPAQPQPPAQQATNRAPTAPQQVVLLEFNVKSKSGKKPGAAATVGAGAVGVGAATAGTVTAAAASTLTGATAGKAAAGVATGGVMDRMGATVEADAARMAKGVAKQIAELMKSQTWAAPRQPAAPH